MSNATLKATILPHHNFTTSKFRIMQQTSITTEKAPQVWGKVSHNLSQRWADTYGQISYRTLFGAPCVVVATIGNPSTTRTIPLNRVHYIDDMGSKEAAEQAMVAESTPWLSDRLNWGDVILPNETADKKSYAPYNQTITLLD